MHLQVKVTISREAPSGPASWRATTQNGMNVTAANAAALVIAIRDALTPLLPTPLTDTLVIVTE